MLEIAPHVLLPVRADFENADRVAHQHRHNSPLGKAVWALVRTPRSAPLAVVTVARGVALSWRILTAGYGAAMPDGPARSVRELGSGRPSRSSRTWTSPAISSRSRTGSRRACARY